MLDISRRARLVARLSLSFMFLFFLLSGQINAKELRIEVSSAPVVRNFSFKLFEISTVACSDLSILKKASNAVLSLQNGYITPSDVIEALSRSGVGGVTLRLSMPDRLPVRELSEIERWLCQISGWNGVIIVEENDPVPVGYRPEPPDSLYPGTETVNLKLNGPSGDRVRPLHLTWLVASLVSARPLSRGMAIRAEDMAISLVEYEKNRIYLKDPSQLSGKIVTRSMAKGEPFIERQTDTEDVIKSGMKIRILFKRGPLSVWTVGKALESGAVGETIKVRNEKTRKIVLAEIKGSAIVEVHR